MIKEHKKLYKAGKRWLTVTILATSVGLLLATEKVSADTVNTPTSGNVNTQQVVDANSASVAADSQGADSDGSSNNYTNTNYGYSAQYLSNKSQDQYNYDPVNAAHQDSYHVTDDSAGNVYLNVAGWHATNASLNEPYHWLILFDGTTKSEVTRELVADGSRPDVARAYPNVLNAGQSGFNDSFVIVPDLLSHSLQIVSRWSNDSSNGEGNHTDYWFSPMNFDQRNHAWLDSVTINNNRLQVRGWHTSNQAAGMKYHFIIVWDASQRRELTRLEGSSLARPDIANIYPNIANASWSGFQASFAFLPEMSTDQIQFISRYTNDPSGNSYYCDYWFSPKQLVADQSNNAHLDNVKISSSLGKPDNGSFDKDSLVINGWHATNQSIGHPYHTIIILDAKTHQELERQTVTNQSRPDVARAYPNVLTANDSGFSVQFNLKPEMVTDQIQVISRYSTTADANENYVDYWFNPMTLISDTSNRASLDQFKVDGSHVIAQGWHDSNLAIFKPFHYIILLDKTANREIQRVRVDSNYYRPDIVKVFPTSINGATSGFDVQFNYSPALAGHQLQIVSRWTNDINGNGNNTIDFWFAPQQLTNAPLTGENNQSTVLIPAGYDEAAYNALSSGADAAYLDLAKEGDAMNGEVDNNIGLLNSNKSFIHNAQDQKVIINDPYHLDNNIREQLNQFAARVINKIRQQMPLCSDGLVYASPATAQFGSVITDGYNKDEEQNPYRGLEHDNAVAKAAANASGLNTWVGENLAQGDIFTSTVSADGYSNYYTLDNLKQTVYNAILLWLFNDDNPFGVGGHTTALLNYNGPYGYNHIANRQYISVSLIKGNIVALNFFAVNSSTASAETIAHFADGATDGLD